MKDWQLKNIERMREAQDAEQQKVLLEHQEERAKRFVRSGPHRRED